MRYAMTLLAALCGCGELKDESNAVRAAEGVGMTDVRVTGKHGIAPTFYGCSDKDAVAFDVQGKNAHGKATSATVCCGLVMKGCTVRY